MSPADPRRHGAAAVTQLPRYGAPPGTWEEQADYVSEKVSKVCDSVNPQVRALVSSSSAMHPRDSPRDVWRIWRYGTCSSLLGARTAARLCVQPASRARETGLSRSSGSRECCWPPDAWCRRAGSACWREDGHGDMREARPSPDRETGLHNEVWKSRVLPTCRRWVLRACGRQDSEWVREAGPHRGPEPMSCRRASAHRTERRRVRCPRRPSSRGSLRSGRDPAACQCAGRCSTKSATACFHQVSRIVGFSRAWRHRLRCLPICPVSGARRCGTEGRSNSA